MTVVSLQNILSPILSLCYTQMCIKPDSDQRAPTYFEQIDLAVCVVVILQAVKRVVVSVAVDRAHSWTWGVGAVEIATMTHASKVSNRKTEDENDFVNH